MKKSKKTLLSLLVLPMLFGTVVGSTSGIARSESMFNNSVIKRAISDASFAEDLLPSTNGGSNAFKQSDGSFLYQCDLSMDDNLVSHGIMTNDNGNAVLNIEKLVQDNRGFVATDTGYIAFAIYNGSLSRGDYWSIAGTGNTEDAFIIDEYAQVDADGFEVGSNVGVNTYVFVQSNVKTITLNLTGSSTAYEYLSNSQEDVTVIRCADFSYIEGPLLTDGSTKTIYVNIDSGYSIDLIVKQVSASDLFGQEVPVSIDSSRTNYVPGELGTFNIGLTATDNYGQTASATIIVKVLDYTAPTITLISPVSCKASEGITQEQLLSHLSITDNIDAGPDIDVNCEIPVSIEDYFEWNTPLKVGVYPIDVIARDQSNRSTTLTINVQVIDDIAPVITRIDGQSNDSVFKIGVSGIKSTLNKSLLSFFNYTDNVSSYANISKSIIDSNITNKVGTYTAKVCAIDEAGNRSTVSIYVEVVQDLPPVFILSNNLIITNVTTPLNVNDLKQIASYLLNTTVDDVQLLENSDAEDYLANSKKAGYYTIRAYSANTETFTEFDLQVDDIELLKSEVKGWSWVSSFFQSLGLSIKKIFTEFKFEWVWVLDGREILMDK